MSTTTKSTSTAAQGRRPMIVDITQPVSDKNNKKKRKRLNKDR
jgi:hypothetical protein